MGSGALEGNRIGVDLINACSNSCKTSHNASIKVNNPILVMACGFACSSAFIVPSHDSVRTSALTGKQIKVKATNSIRGMDAAQWGRGLQPTKSLRRLLDHLVGAGEQSRRNIEAERLSGLHVDCQLDFCGLLDRQISRLGALEDAASPHRTSCRRISLSNRVFSVKGRI